MLKTVNRLKKDADFSIVSKSGKSMAGAYFIMKWAVNSRKAPRIGIVVSTKVSKKAVTRNLIKRRVRGVCAKMLKNGLIKPNIDVFFIAKQQAQKAKYQEMETDIAGMVKKAKIG